jgi:hypothetical protein
MDMVRSPKNTNRFSGLEAWIHSQLMRGSDELCFTYRRQVEQLRERAAALNAFPPPVRRRQRATLRQWDQIRRLEEVRLK